MQIKALNCLSSRQIHCLAALIITFFFRFGYKNFSVFIVFVCFSCFCILQLGLKKGKPVYNNKNERNFWNALVHIFPVSRKDLAKINVNRCLPKRKISQCLIINIVITSCEVGPGPVSVGANSHHLFHSKRDWFYPICQIKNICFNKLSCSWKDHATLQCFLSYLRKWRVSVKAFVFLSQVQPLPISLFPFLPAWNTNIILRGAAAILKQRSDKHEDKSFILRMVEVENRKSLLSLLSIVRLPQTFCCTGQAC